MFLLIFVFKTSTKIISLLLSNYCSTKFCINSETIKFEALQTTILFGRLTIDHGGY